MIDDLPPEIDKRIQHILPRDLLHELRTPLSQILGYSELLIEQMQDAGSEEYVPHLEKIRKAGRELVDMLKENFQSER
jgi:signal transduction histidine kinase